MAPEPKEVLALAEKIVNVEKELTALKLQWERMFSPSEENTIKSTRGKRDGSFAAKVEALLSSDPGRVFTIGQVADALKEQPLKVGRTLFRLADTEHIENTGRGLYRAKQTPEVAAA